MDFELAEVLPAAFVAASLLVVALVEAAAAVLDSSEAMALSNHQGAFLADSSVLLTPPDLVVFLPDLLDAFARY